jgi:virginiamycin B lyase
VAGDCPTKTNQTASCSAGQCTYTCASNYKSCTPGGSCIPITSCCVESDCLGTCQTCASNNACSPVTNADDPDSCTGTMSCNATGVCLKKLGQPCSKTTDCLSNFCADGFCCNEACGESCHSCATGTCSPVKNAEDPDTCQLTQTCDATGTCVSKFTQYTLPSGHQVNKLAIGSDGNLWFTGTVASTIGVLNRTTGVVSEFLTPTSSAFPDGIAAGSDGNLWFTERGVGRIGKCTVAGQITEYPLTSGTATDVALGGDGNIWFPIWNIPGSAIGKVTPAGAITVTTVSATSGGDGGAAFATDGSFWFAESSQNKVARVNISTSATTEFTIPTAMSFPNGMSGAPATDVWMVEFHTSKIARIVAAGTFDEIGPLMAGGGGFDSPEQVATAADGSAWYTGFNCIGHVVPSTRAVTVYPIPGVSGGTVYGILVASDGTIWFAEGGKIGQFHP